MSGTDQCYLRAYAGGTEAVSHKEVKGGTGLNPSGIHAAAAMLQDPLAEVGTLLHFLFKQQVSKLKEGAERGREACNMGCFQTAGS